MKRIYKLLLCSLVAIMLLATGCGNSTTKISYTYTVETGDNIKISLTTNDGYSLTSDVPFVISKDDEELSQGTFISADYYDQYIESVKSDDNAKIIDEGENDNFSYVMWNYNDSEYDYVILVNGTNTGVLLGNNVSEESAKECFERLEIEEAE